MVDLPIWNASGNRHETLPGANENPSVNQFEIAKPVMQFAIWMIISLPRLLIFDVSDCQTPAVAVFIPVPSPATTRPTYICAAPKEVA